MLDTIWAIGGRFLRDTRGGAGSIAAAGIIIMTLGGSALIIDHNHLVGQRDILKSAADAASLAATLRLNSLPDTLTDDEIRDAVLAFARKYAELNVLGNVNDPDTSADDITITFDMDRTQKTVTTVVSADTGNTLIAAWLYGYLGPGKVTTASGVEGVESSVEVVLAIDVSGSMNRTLEGAWVGHADPDSRMSIVKRAAVDLVAILQPGADSGIAVGVVPWDSGVRLDAAASANWASQGWASYPDRRRYPATYQCTPPATCTPVAETQDLPATAPPDWRGCLDEQRIAGGVADITPEADWFDHPSVSPFAQAFYPATYGTSYNCSARPVPGNLRRQVCYGGNNSGSNRVIGNSAPEPDCAIRRPIFPLSTEASEIVQYIGDLRAIGGWTNSPMGLLWGQRLLTPEWRDVWGGGDHPKDVSPDVRKAIVLLTDGEDTHCGDNDQDCERSSVGYDRADVCTAAKDAGAEIFVVAAMPPSQVTGDFGAGLIACSSQDERPGTYTFLNNSDAATLRAAFTSIANQLRSVRRIY